MQKEVTTLFINYRPSNKRLLFYLIMLCLALTSFYMDDQDFLTISGKRKRDDYASQLNSKGHIPQQDGSGDATIEFFLPEVCIFVS